MNHEAQTKWYEANQRYLNAPLHRVLARLQAVGLSTQGDRRAGAGQGASDRRDTGDAAVLSPPAALATVCLVFALTPFERDLL